MTRRLIRATVVLLVASMAHAESEQPFDLVPFGYVFRADWPANQNPPETQWLTNGLKDVVAGVMWEEHRPVREIEFCFAENAPDPSLMTLEVTANTPNAGQDNRPTWWTRAWESFPGTAKAYVFREHPNRAGDGGGGDKTFEVAAFLERFRAMLVLEDGDRLWLARGIPRAWLEQGKKVRVQNAPSRFGTVAYQLVSDVDHGRIRATLEVPARDQPRQILLRLRHPRAAPIRTVTVNGRSWSDFDSDKETVSLSGLQGKVEVEVRY